MNRIATVFLALWLYSSLATAARIDIPGTSASFESPENFTALTQDEINIKFPNGTSPPAFVVGNERRTTSVAYDLKPIAIKDENLEEVLTAFSAVFESQIKGLVWVERKIINKQGQRWLYLEMKSSAIDTNIHNIMLLTPHENKMLVFNFNSTAEEFPKLEAALRLSIESILISKAQAVTDKKPAKA
jgi:hypothetical protein